VAIVQAGYDGSPVEVNDVRAGLPPRHDLLVGANSRKDAVLDEHRCGARVRRIERCDASVIKDEFGHGGFSQLGSGNAGQEREAAGGERALHDGAPGNGGPAGACRTKL
jgi:hypothetical protein